jgi:hypothetical protein
MLIDYDLKKSSTAKLRQKCQTAKFFENKKKRATERSTRFSIMKN